MSENEIHQFHMAPSRLYHIAGNIAFAPIIFYLFRVWPWPPTLVHLGVFAITFILAYRYYKSRVTITRLQISLSGIQEDQLIPAASIEAVKPAGKTLKLKLVGEEQEHVVHLWWASAKDIVTIQNLAKETFGEYE